MTLPLLSPPEPEPRSLTAPDRCSGAFASPYGDGQLPTYPDKDSAGFYEPDGEYTDAPTVDYAPGPGFSDWNSVVGGRVKPARAYARF